MQAFAATLHSLAVPLKDLYQACDPLHLDFETTAELQALTGIIGQSRAMDAVRFGAGMRHEGYNLYVLGPSGLGKRSLVSQFLKDKAESEEKSADWCYINNFAHPHKPMALQLPSGRGAELQLHMAQLVDYLRTAIPALFEADEYRAKVEAIQQEFTKLQENAFQELGREAREKQLILLRTPGGFAFAPARNQEVIPPDEYEKLPESEKNIITSTIADLQTKLEKILTHIPQLWRDKDEKIKQLNRETIRLVLVHLVDALRQRFANLAAVQSYLDAVQTDMIENADDFRKQDEPHSLDGLTLMRHELFHRYKVNALVTNGKQTGAPLVSEDNPTYSNLFGRVEHIAQLGALVTDFTLIKPGALHRANGGYLLLDVRKVLTQPFAWEGLKHALQSHEIRIESLGQMFSLVSTVSLEPQPIPLDVKIVLFGDPLIYYLLHEYDPDFGELFKVAADFEDRIERSAETHMLYARLMAMLCSKHQLLPLDRSAVAKVIEQSARIVGDAERLSTRMRSIVDLLQEADYWSRQDGIVLTTAAVVQQAIDQQIRRQDRLRDLLRESILRGNLLIDTDGFVVGQINALSVISLGDFSFAQPIRVTGTTRVGQGEMVNIEREVELSGAIHSKGVLILSSFLATRYAHNTPLALSASLVFEQSYGLVEGDSASLAELCVLLSHLAGVPINQSLSVSGSINQWGQVQAIGGVNEKIEGFFDICLARKLNGTQGVVIPAANVKHLMLRKNVLDAVEAGNFHIYAVSHVDQAIALLTGVPAGEAGANGRYPPDTVNGKVAARLGEFNKPRKALAKRVKVKEKMGE